MERKIVSKSKDPVAYTEILAVTLKWLVSRKESNPEEFVWVKNKATGVGAPHFKPSIPMPIYGIDIDLSSEEDIARLTMLKFNETGVKNPFFLELRP